MTVARIAVLLMGVATIVLNVCVIWPLQRRDERRIRELERWLESAAEGKPQ